MTAPSDRARPGRPGDPGPVRAVAAALQARLDALPPAAASRATFLGVYARVTVAVADAVAAGGSRTPTGSPRGTRCSPTSSSPPTTPTCAAPGAPALAARLRRRPGDAPARPPPAGHERPHQLRPAAVGGRGARRGRLRRPRPPGRPRPGPRAHRRGALRPRPRRGRRPRLELPSPRPGPRPREPLGLTALPARVAGEGLAQHRRCSTPPAGPAETRTRAGSPSSTCSTSAKIAEFLRPGPVLLRLALQGFGVTLPPS